MIANTARFKSDMRSAAKDGIGGFTEEYQAAMGRRLPSQKTLVEAAKGEGEAWRTALHGEVAGFGKQAYQLGGALLPGIGDLGGELRPDKAAAHRRRVLEMLPWGMSTRVELSREAALTAAAIGDGSKKIGHALGAARGDLASLAGEIGGAAGLGSLGRFFTTPGGMLTAGIAVLGAKMVHDTAERYRWASEVRLRGADGRGVHGRDRQAALRRL